MVFALEVVVEAALEKGNEGGQWRSVVTEWSLHRHDASPLHGAGTTEPRTLWGRRQRAQRAGVLIVGRARGKHHNHCRTPGPHRRWAFRTKMQSSRTAREPKPEHFIPNNMTDS